MRSWQTSTFIVALLAEMVSVAIAIVENLAAAPWPGGLWWWSVPCVLTPLVFVAAWTRYLHDRREEEWRKREEEWRKEVRDSLNTLKEPRHVRAVHLEAELRRAGGVTEQAAINQGGLDAARALTAGAYADQRAVETENETVNRLAEVQGQRRGPEGRPGDRVTPTLTTPPARTAMGVPANQVGTKVHTASEVRHDVPPMRSTGGEAAHRRHKVSPIYASSGRRGRLLRAWDRWRTDLMESTDPYLRHDPLRRSRHSGLLALYEKVIRTCPEQEQARTEFALIHAQMCRDRRARVRESRRQRAAARAEASAGRESHYNTGY
jgi:hypothetical protein